MRSPSLTSSKRLPWSAKARALPHRRSPPAPEPTPAPLTADIPLDDAVGIQGDPNAPVVIVEYTDLQCPFCQRHFQQVMPELQKLIDSGQVLYAVRTSPLTSIHPQALAAANAGRCAAEQDHYWEMHDILFENQQAWSGNAGAIDIFKEYAGQLGLNTGAFNDRLDNKNTRTSLPTTFRKVWATACAALPLSSSTASGCPAPIPSRRSSRSSRR